MQVVCEERKREAKAKGKATDKWAEEVPLKVNFYKFLADERKTAVLDMAKRKLRNTTDDATAKVFLALVELD